ncbi:MAG: folate-binding protein YgfZ [Cyanobacteria bacterium SID2]|nr:folate-binding protein YgfZ [Cyanobacteria bacterium SID2]MBP0005051.1 folate-binding protein YgfZ [Cyanobacteria bacterium SBC]
MNRALREIQLASGATFGDVVAGVTAPIDFGNDEAALAAVCHGVALVDRSHWGRIQMSGDDRLRFLHNASTNDIIPRQPRTYCDTVFVTSTARTIDLATVWFMEEALLLLVSPSCREQLMQWLDRYIFPADKVELLDRTEETACFTLVGEGVQSWKSEWEAIFETPLEIPEGTHQRVQWGSGFVDIAAGSDLALPGYTLICSAEDAASLWKALFDRGAIPMGETLWNRLRIEQGRPAPDAELTEDYNPLEARLWHTVSFDKGCYIGQETIARLNTYKGVKQQLWGLRLSGFVPAGTPIMFGDEKVGKLTSVVETESGYLGLGYVRTKAGGKGLSVCLGEVTAEVVDVPFLPAEQES